MTWELILTIISAGTIGGLISEGLSFYKRKLDNKYTFKKEQIEKLYGPVYIRIIESEKIFELYRKYHEAYNAEYIDKQYSMDRESRELLMKDCQSTLDIANSYLQIVKNNNKEIFSLIRNNISFFEMSHTNEFMDFYENHIRLIYEKDEEEKRKIPFEITQHLGDISYLPPDIIKEIKSTYHRMLDDIYK